MIKQKNSENRDGQDDEDLFVDKFRNERQSQKVKKEKYMEIQKELVS